MGRRYTPPPPSANTAARAYQSTSNTTRLDGYTDLVSQNGSLREIVPIQAQQLTSNSSMGPNPSTPPPSDPTPSPDTGNSPDPGTNPSLRPNQHGVLQHVGAWVPAGSEERSLHDMGI
ncbi:hypothetical protein TWF696_009210 [Orbilia brochopaga]|uniref:Uncharacterized protein n=1 Tax=Orbilia brochopaga TaxID=3140254 RepID=A0AAV9UI17_9PEZI